MTAGGPPKEALAKFQTYHECDSTGIIGIPTYNVKGENTLKVKVIGSGVGNAVTVYGRIENEDVFNSLEVITGNATSTIDISTIDYVRFACTVFGGLPFELIVSGFYAQVARTLSVSGEIHLLAPTGPFEITTALITDTPINPLGAALTKRVSLSIRNVDNANSVFLGKSASVTSSIAVGTTSGWELFPNSADQNLDLDEGEDFYLVCSAGKTALVQVFEIASVP
jgi:hypothetical protein